MNNLTHEQLVERVAKAISGAPFPSKSSLAKARAAIATIAEATREPTEAMETARGIDPEDCATPDAAVCVWCAMHRASPLYPEGK